MMTTFVVMDIAENAKSAEAKFVRDKFSVLAFLLPVIWLAWHRLWIEAFAALAATIVLAALGTLAGFQNTAPLLSLLVSVFVAIEGPQLRIRALERRGYVQAAALEADHEAEAEIRYYESDNADQASAVTQNDGPPADVALGRTTPAAPGPALGLLDYPGNR
ncbi:MAG: DUF2628 domain-containing protein [Rhizobiaceae bacterium]